MVHRNPVHVRNGGDAPLVVVVEPWASEFELPPGAECDVILTHPEAPPMIAIELVDGYLILWVNEGGSYYEVWRNGVQID